MSSLQPRTKEIGQGAQDGGRYHVILVKPAQLRELRQIFDQFRARVDELRTQDPSYVSVVNSMNNWRMDILFGVRVPVVMPVVRSPPDWTLLCSGGSKETQHELKRSACLVRAVREVAVVTTCYGEHAYDVQEEAHRESYPAEAHPQGRKASNVHRPEDTLLENITEFEIVLNFSVAVIHVSIPLLLSTLIVTRSRTLNKSWAPENLKRKSTIEDSMTPMITIHDPSNITFAEGKANSKDRNFGNLRSRRVSALLNSEINYLAVGDAVANAEGL